MITSPRHPLNLSHVVVPNCIGLTIIPSNSDTAPCCPNNSAEIGRATSPANPVTYFKQSGLIAGHCKQLMMVQARMVRSLSTTTKRL